MAALQFFVIVNNEILGPLSAEQIKAKLIAGELQQSDKISADCKNNWHLISSVKGLHGFFQATVKESLSTSESNTQAKPPQIHATTSFPVLNKKDLPPILQRPPNDLPSAYSAFARTNALKILIASIGLIVIATALVGLSYVLFEPGNPRELANTTSPTGLVSPVVINNSVDQGPAKVKEDTEKEKAAAKAKQPKQPESVASVSPNNATETKPNLTTYESAAKALKIGDIQLESDITEFKKRYPKYEVLQNYDAELNAVLLAPFIDKNMPVSFLFLDDKLIHITVLYNKSKSGELDNMKVRYGNPRPTKGNLNHLNWEFGKVDRSIRLDIDSTPGFIRVAYVWDSMYGVYLKKLDAKRMSSVNDTKDSYRDILIGDANYGKLNRFIILIVGNELSSDALNTKIGTINKLAKQARCEEEMLLDILRINIEQEKMKGLFSPAMALNSLESAIAHLVVQDKTTGSTPSNDQLRACMGHNGAVIRTSISADGKILATGSKDGTGILWNTKTKEKIRVLGNSTHPINNVSMSADGRLLATASNDKPLVLWNTSDGEQLRTFTGHNLSANCICLSPDGKVLACSSDFTNIELWNAETGEKSKTLIGHLKEIKSIAISVDGKILASGATDNTAIIWNTITGEKRIVGHTESVESVSLNADGSILATMQSNGTAYLWDSRTGEKLHHFDDASNSICLSSNSKVLATVSADKIVTIWDTASGIRLHSFVGHTDDILSVSLSANGNVLASGAVDETALLWDPTREETPSDRHKLLNKPGHVRSIDNPSPKPPGKVLFTRQMGLRAGLVMTIAFTVLDPNAPEAIRLKGLAASIVVDNINDDGVFELTGRSQATFYQGEHKFALYPSKGSQETEFRYTMLYADYDATNLLDFLSGVGKKSILINKSTYYISVEDAKHIAELVEQVNLERAKKGYTVKNSTKYYTPSFKQIPVPSREEQESAQVLIRKEYKKEMDDSQLAAKKIALAETLLSAASKEGTTASQRYGMLVAARELSISASDVMYALNITNIITEQFYVNAAHEHLSVLEKCLKTVNTKKAWLSIAAAGIHNANLMANKEYYTTAIRFARIAHEAATKSYDSNAIKQAVSMGSLINAINVDYQNYVSAHLRLSIEPDDPTANMHVGRWRWFRKNSPDVAMLHLSKTPTSLLQSAAMIDQSRPNDPLLQLELADKWWSLSQVTKEAVAMTCVKARSKYWYLNGSCRNCRDPRKNTQKNESMKSQLPKLKSDIDRL